MKLADSFLIAMALAVGVGAPVASQGQVDPEWLASWNEAQDSRPATIPSSGRIGTEGEPGEPLIIRGQVFNPDDAPADGVVVHAYQRDHAGFEFGPGDNSVTTWRLQGWAKTDAQGRFEFHTIRPAPDHMGREGAHIHFTLESKDYGRQWVPKVFFADDPMVGPDLRRRSAQDGEFGWVREVETIDGVQHIDVRFRLKVDSDF